MCLGHPEETEDHIAQAFRLSPRDSFANLWYGCAGAAKLFLGRDDEAVSWFRRSIETSRTFPIGHFFLAAALALQGKVAEAQVAAKAGLALAPTFTVRRFRDGALSSNSTYLAQRNRVYEGLREAEVPEE